MMRADLQLHTLGEIIAYYADGSHDDELDGSHLYEWPVSWDSEEAVTVDSTFYVMPPADLDDETGKPLWRLREPDEAENMGNEPEVVELAQRLGLEYEWHGDILTDTLSLIRDRAAGASPTQIAEALDFYLKHDTWPEWLA